MYEFEDIHSIYLSFQQIKSRLISLAASAYMDKYNVNIKVELEKVEKILTVFDLANALKKEYV